MKWITRLRSGHAKPLASREPSDVIVIDDPWPEILAARRSAMFDAFLPERKPWKLWTGAAGLTVVVHSLFVGSLAFGSRGRTTRPPLTEGVTADGKSADGKETVSILFFVNDHSIHVSEEGDDSAYTVSEPDVVAPKDPLMISSTLSSLSGEPPTLEEIDPTASPSEDATGDGAEAAALFGRYMGQVKARIERAWDYTRVPTTNVGSCRVQIRQTRNGDIQGINVQRCDMDLATQMSLVRAIQAASPLSAPPREKLFTEVVTLGFTASPQLTDTANSNTRSRARNAVRSN